VYVIDPYAVQLGLRSLSILVIKSYIAGCKNDSDSEHSLLFAPLRPGAVQRRRAVVRPVHIHTSLLEDESNQRTASLKPDIDDSLFAGELSNTFHRTETHTVVVIILWNTG
jgi:hypothetical protein